MLDAVIALDAPDEILVERIRSRPEHHRIKAESHSAAQSFLERYRTAYREIIEKIGAGPRLLQVDTSRSSPDEVAAAAREHIARLQAPA